MQNSNSTRVRVIELSPIDGRKSFYGKCKALHIGDIVQLVSYDTIVAVVDVVQGTYREVEDVCMSNTTKRHVRAFKHCMELDDNLNKEL